MKKRWVEISILVLLSLLIVWAGKGLFKYSFFQTHDLKRHLVRGYDAVLTIREGHFPLRWAGLTNYECGTPTFNFYYPFFYYLIVLVDNFSNSIMLSIKIISFISLAFGTLFFYLWMKEETESKLSSFASAVLYLYAPYRFSLIYVRGDPEYISYAILPIVLYFFAKLFKTKTNFQFVITAFLAAVSGGILAISHNLVSVFVMPIILLYLLIKLIQTKGLSRPKVVTILFSFISAFGLGAFFIFPAIIEERFTKIGISIFNYFDHFPTLWQMFFSKWGYGDSAIGIIDDGMSFQLGYAHWLVLGLVLLWLIIKRRLNDILIPIFFALSVLFIFLILPWSLPIWQKITILQVVDFPWRLLGICVFLVSALFGFWVPKIKTKKLYLLIVFGTILISIVGNRNYLLAQPVLESELSSYGELDRLSAPRRSIPAYADNILPPSSRTSCYLTTKPVSSNNEKDKIVFEEQKRGSTFGTINLKIDKRKIVGDKVIFNLSYYPDIYTFFVNDNTYAYLDCEGMVCIKTTDLKDGINSVAWKINQTKVQNLFNIITLVFLIVWISIIGYTTLKLIYRKK